MFGASSSQFQLHIKNLKTLKTMAKPYSRVEGSASGTSIFFVSFQVILTCGWDGELPGPSATGGITGQGVVCPRHQGSTIHTPPGSEIASEGDSPFVQEAGKSFPTWQIRLRFNHIC